MKVKVPPIKCQGIKTKLVPWILANCAFPEEGVWIEPFMGSGVVGFNACPRRAIFSDLNPHIIRFYQAIQQGEITPPIARKYLETEGRKLEEIGDKYYYEVRTRFNTHHHPLDFLFLSRAGFNGVIRFNSRGEYNVPFCKKTKRFSKAYITKIVNQITYIYELLKYYKWEFKHGDFENLILNAGEKDFIYCDPPYYGRHVDYYNTWGEEEEKRLSRALHSTKAKFILSTWHSNKYRKNPNIDRYWNDFHILTKEHFYHIGAKEENRNSMLEALVLNYEPPAPVIEKSYRQLALFEERAKYRSPSDKTA
ncbi:MAG: Dam family site-specific DNA-(adenine-N6)-methyltransferase [Calditrichaeota bacterium]|nr:MAG: Dam family site-specific DNA-(adenine-N6)-methyltransferase [Calditrichota bacterium]